MTDAALPYQVISFSLYGEQRRYCVGAIENIDLARVHYPGWRCRIYVDDTVPQFYQDEIVAKGAELVKVTKRALGPMYGRYWRFWVAADPRVDWFIIRDADSRLNPREKAAVDEWIASGKSFHIMRDSAYHRTRALGGMWGGIGGRLPDIAALIDRWGQYDSFGQCDRFVADVLFPLMQGDYLCHDGAGYYDDGRPFPPHSALDGTRYVGEIVEVDRPPLDIWRQSAEFENQLYFAMDRAERLEIKVVELTDVLQRLDAELFTARHQSAEFEDRLHFATNRAEQLAIKVAELTDVLQSLEAERVTAGHHIEALSREIAAMKTSTSWRLTLPLRLMKTFVIRRGPK